MGGKPMGEKAQDVRVIFRATFEERERWQRAAKRDGLDFSTWLRGLAERRATTKARKAKR